MTGGSDARRETCRTLCRMCADRCGIEVHLENGRAVEITGDPDHVFSRGRTCLKAPAAVEMVHHPDRLTTPLRRTRDGSWEEVGLDEALDEIAVRLEQIAAESGRRSIGVWKGEAVGFDQQEALARRFAHAIGTPNYLSNDSMCAVARMIGYRVVCGDRSLLPDLDHADCIVVWGSDPPASLPNMAHAIAGARRRGAELVVVDPRQTSVARHAAVHAQVRPGTDGALAWALLRELIASDACDDEFIAGHAVGFDEARAYAQSFTPQVAEEETGVPAATVRTMAAILARAAPRVAFYAGNGLEHNRGGVDGVRTIVMLAGALGAVDRVGGLRRRPPSPLRDLTLYDEVPLRHLEPVGADRFPVLYDTWHECHTMTAFRQVLDGEPSALRALIVTGGNPALTNPDSESVTRALAALDLLVVRDLFLSETAALADYVMPAASFLERGDFHLHPETRSITLSRPVLRLPGVQTEYEFWHDLAHRLDAGPYFPWDDERELDRWLLEGSGLTLEELEAHPEGVVCADEEPSDEVREAFATPSGRFEFAAAEMEQSGYGRLPEYRRPGYLADPDQERPFVLITGARTLAFVASRYRNLPSLRRREKGPAVEIDPADAARLGIEDGDVVRVSSRTGSLEVPARVVRPGGIVRGAVQLTHGWREANANRLTPDDRFDPVSGFPTVKEVEVAVEKAGADA